MSRLFVLACLAVCAAAGPIVLFDTGSPDGRLGAATRPGLDGKLEIEAADDFLLTSGARITSATFTGLITGASPTIGDVAVEFYNIFPLDSNTIRTITVPTRANSPSDVDFASRDTAGSTLSFSTSILNPTFSALNSVLNGINPSPGQTTGGEGAIRGSEVQFTVTFLTPLDLNAGHFFFIPQVQVTGGEFYWLSSPKPITGGTGPFSPDLQAWIRNGNLDPDWLRIGTDIISGNSTPTFNMSFSLSGVSTPEPSSLALVGMAIVGGLLLRRR